MNVICLWWQGDFRGRDFQPEDVWNLGENLRRHMDRPFKFYCLTNNTQAALGGAERIPLKHNWPGWWSKVELHRPDLPPGRTLYLDLDTYVIRNLKPILDFPGDLVMFPSTLRERQGRLDGMVRKYQAAVMLFNPGSTSRFYDRFCASPPMWMGRYRSEQDMMGDFLPDQPTFPKKWLLKMSKAVKMSEPPEEAIIVTGQPAGPPGRRHIVSIGWLDKMARGPQ